MMRKRSPSAAICLKNISQVPTEPGSMTSAGPSPPVSIYGQSWATPCASIRTLRTAGVIRGFHAEVDPAALGRGLQAMVAVRMQSGARNRLSAFAQRLAARPEVLDLYFVAGADDFLVHVAVEDSEALREFVLEQLSAFPEVALTETSLIFEHVRTSSARPL